MSYRSITLTLTFLLFTIPQFLLANPHNDGHGEDHEHSHGERKGASVQGTPLLKFIENKGQWEGDFRYQTDIPGGRMWITDKGFVYSLQDMEQLERIHDYFYHGKPRPGETPDTKLINCHAFEVEFLNANLTGNARFETSGPYLRYYLSLLHNDPTKCASTMRVYGKVS